jgi:hypothetical protein
VRVSNERKVENSRQRRNYPVDPPLIAFGLVLLSVRRLDSNLGQDEVPFIRLLEISSGLDPCTKPRQAR